MVDSLHYQFVYILLRCYFVVTVFFCGCACVASDGQLLVGVVDCLFDL